MTRKLLALSIPALLVLSLGACSDSETPVGPDPIPDPQPVVVEMDAVSEPGEHLLELSVDEVPSGWVTFRLTNTTEDTEHFALIARLPDGVTIEERSEASLFRPDPGRRIRAAGEGGGGPGPVPDPLPRRRLRHLPFSRIRLRRRPPVGGRRFGRRTFGDRPRAGTGGGGSTASSSWTAASPGGSNSRRSSRPPTGTRWREEEDISDETLAEAGVRRDPFIKPLDLTPEEMEAVVAFMKTTTAPVRDFPLDLVSVPERVPSGLLPPGVPTPEEPGPYLPHLTRYRRLTQNLARNDSAVSDSF